MEAWPVFFDTFNDAEPLVCSLCCRVAKEWVGFPCTNAAVDTTA